MKTDQDLINSLYKRHRKRPSTLGERGLHLLADFIVEESGMELDDDKILFTEMSETSPFRAIRLDNINGVEDLGGVLAIVMHSSIIFFNKSTHEASVHIKPLSFIDRLSHLLSLR